MLEYVLLAAGFALLLKGADWLVDGSSALAKKLGIPPLVIGLTVVAFGTSMPELVVNVLAALRGSSDISFGNILGSNIANLLLILGASALLLPLKVQSSTVWKEIPFALLAGLILLAQSSKPTLDGTTASVLTRSDGLILIAFFAIFLYYVAVTALAHRGQTIKGAEAAHKNWPTILLSIIGGLLALYFGGRWIVTGAVAVAKTLGLSELLISATIVAIGTSLPELITSLAAARKQEFDLSVGNIVGSNIFNIFLVMGVTAVLSPVGVPAGIRGHFLFEIAATLLLFFFMFLGKKHILERWQGGFFLLGYAGYIAFLFING